MRVAGLLSASLATKITLIIFVVGLEDIRTVLTRKSRTRFEVVRSW